MMEPNSCGVQTLKSCEFVVHQLRCKLITVHVCTAFKMSLLLGTTHNLPCLIQISVLEKNKNTIIIARFSVEGLEDINDLILIIHTHISHYFDPLKRSRFYYTMHFRQNTFRSRILWNRLHRDKDIGWHCVCSTLTFCIILTR